jgi:UDP-N-acetylmuramoyl-L-alanyl-D-glutamate--2,6-diaminopimelate ligase
VLDDAANHPDAISALFEVVEQLPVERAHAIFAIRGNRGPQINRRTAEALAIWSRRRPLDTLILTRSEDVVGEWERVRDEERTAFRGALRRAGIAFQEVGTLAEAVESVMARVEPGDLVLTLGTQGMDGAPERLREWLERRSGIPAGPGARDA